MSVREMDDETCGSPRKRCRPKWSWLFYVACSNLVKVKSSLNYVEMGLPEWHWAGSPSI
jgi:hypothetical protein